MAAEASRPLLSTKSVIGGSVVGLVHAGVAVFLWHHFGFDNLRELLAIKPLIGLYLLSGMFLLGFVPAACYVGKRLVAPTVVIAGLLTLTVAGSWLVGPVRAPTGAPTPFGLYVLTWVAILALAGLAGVIELKRTRRTSS